MAEIYGYIGEDFQDKEFVSNCARHAQEEHKLVEWIELFIGVYNRMRQANIHSKADFASKAAKVALIGLGI